MAFVQALRGRNDALARIPVIGCTASAVPEDHHAALQAGMDGILVKPVGLQALGEAVRTYACGRGPAPASTPVALPWPRDETSLPSPAPKFKSDRWCEICEAMNVQCDRFRQSSP